MVCDVLRYRLLRFLLKNLVFFYLFVDIISGYAYYNFTIINRYQQRRGKNKFNKDLVLHSLPHSCVGIWLITMHLGISFNTIHLVITHQDNISVICYSLKSSYYWILNYSWPTFLLFTKFFVTALLISHRTFSVSINSFVYIFIYVYNLFIYTVNITH